MQTYSEISGSPPDFEVRYRFLDRAEGGLFKAPYQHVRWDFLYEGDKPESDGISMIWPEFVDPSGSVLPEGEVPLAGKAIMFIINPDRRPFHRRRIAVGVRGFFVEGSHKVAECEVTAILGLAPQEGSSDPRAI